MADAQRRGASIERGAAFGVEIGEYRGVIRVPRRVFQRLLPERPTPERCVEAYYLQQHPVREHRRAKAAPAPVDRGWDCRDQRAGLSRVPDEGGARPPEGASQI